MRIFDFPDGQGSREWHDFRRGRPTASEFKRIITAVGCKYSKGAERYMDQLIGESMAFHYPEGAPSYTSRAMDWGHEMENSARLWYRDNAKLGVRRVGCVATDDMRFSCSPDGIVIAPGTEFAPGELPNEIVVVQGKILGGLEIKCPEKPEVQIGRVRAGSLPNDSKAQVHGGLAITGLPWWDHLSYCEGCPELLVRTKPDTFTTELKVCLERFWMDYAKALAKVKSL